MWATAADIGPPSSRCLLGGPVPPVQLLSTGWRGVSVRLLIIPTAHGLEPAMLCPAWELDVLRQPAERGLCRAPRSWCDVCMELAIPVEGGELSATLTVPPEPVRAGVVVLHGAEAGERSYFLYEHLAHLLGGSYVAVLRYDRRRSRDGEDVPLPVQASDAVTAVRCLRQVVGPVPTGLWGFSQGAWAAPLAAVTAPDRVDFLICVSCCGVSPAEQMRVRCSRQLRKHGFSDSEVEELTRTRLAVEQFLRTGQGSESARTMLGTVAARPWFRHAYLPDRPPEPGSWPDVDFDPRPVLTRLSCPVLAFYGESDEWMPIEESLAAWQAAKEHGTLTDVRVVRLAGTDHLPTVGGRTDPRAISTVYSDTLMEWVTSLHRLPAERLEES